MVLRKESSAQSKGKHICCIVAFGSKWKLVGRFYGMLHLSAKRHRFIIWWEDALWKAFWENHLKDRLFHLVHWLSITLFLRKTSQESINLERKSYLDCSSDTLCTREEFGRVTYWLQTLRTWRRWTHRKSTRKDSIRKRWYFPNKENSFFQSQMDESNSLEEIKAWKPSRPNLAKPDLANLIWPHLAKPNLANTTLFGRIRPIFVDQIWPDRILPIFCF